MDEVAAAGGIRGFGFSTRQGSLVQPWGTNMGEVALALALALAQETAASPHAPALVSSRGAQTPVRFSAPQAPLSGRTWDTYMGELAGGASAHPGSWPAESWLFTPQ